MNQKHERTPQPKDASTESSVTEPEFVLPPDLQETYDQVIHLRAWAMDVHRELLTTKLTNEWLVEEHKKLVVKQDTDWKRIQDQGDLVIQQQEYINLLESENLEIEFLEKEVTGLKDTVQEQNLFDILHLFKWRNHGIARFNDYSDLQMKKNELKKELETEKRKLEDEKIAIVEKWEMEKKALVEKHETEVSQLIEKYETEAGQLLAQLECEEREHQKQVEKTNKEYLSSYDEVMKKLQSVENEKKELISKFEDQLKKSKESLDQLQKENFGLRERLSLTVNQQQRAFAQNEWSFKAELETQRIKLSEQQKSVDGYKGKIDELQKEVYFMRAELFKERMENGRLQEIIQKQQERGDHRASPAPPNPFLKSSSSFVGASSSARELRKCQARPEVKNQVGSEVVDNVSNILAKQSLDQDAVSQKNPSHSYPPLHKRKKLFSESGNKF